MRQSKKIKLIALEIGHLSKTAISGGDILLEKMYPYLKKQIDLAIIVPEIGSAHWKKHHQVKIHELEPNIFDKIPNKFFFFLSYLVRIYQSCLILKETNAEIIYSSTNIFPDVIPAYLIKIIKPDIIWIARIHHLIPPPTKRVGNLLINTISYLLQILVLKLIKKSDKIITLNDSIATDLRKLGIPGSKLVTIGGGVDLKKIKDSKSSKSQFDAVFVGRAHLTKGIFDLFSIWEKVTNGNPAARLAIIGEIRPEIKKVLRRKINKVLSKNIFLLGFLAENDLYGVLKSSKVFLFTDKEAGFSLASAEAMAAGLPVVAYQTPIFGQVYKKGFLAVAQNDQESFSQTVIKLLKDPKLRKKLSHQAQKQASHLSWQKPAKILEDLLKSHFS